MSSARHRDASRARRALHCLCISLALLTLLGGSTVASAAPDAGILKDEAPVEVVVSVAPLAWFVGRIGGEAVRVQVLVPGNAAPEIYAPRPSQLVSLLRARLCVVVGHPDFGFEATHIRPHLERHPEIRVIDMDRVSKPRDITGDAGRDPHIWLSPRRAAATADAIAEALTALDPGRSEIYAAGLASLRREIDDLDREIRRRWLFAKPGGTARRILVLHPAWGWFGRDYGLEQIAIEQEGKAPGPRQLIPLIEEARKAQMRTVFVQPGFTRERAEQVARAIGAQIVEVDPLAAEWADNLRHVAALFAAADGSQPRPEGASAGRDAESRVTP